MIPVEFGLAFLTGLGGSVHCLGMCSGFALAVARTAERDLRRQMLYSGGRLTSYMLLGVLVGSAGQFLRILLPLKVAQAGLAALAGAALVVIGLRMLGLMQGGRWPDLSSGLARLAGPLAGAIRSLMPPTRGPQAYYVGLLNGMLPCPLVYGLLPVALASGSGAQGGLLMLAMGAGTLPVMLFVGIAGRRLTLRWKGAARVPAIIVLVFAAVTLGRAFLWLAPQSGVAAHALMH